MWHEEEEKKSNKTKWIVLVVLLLFCCCILLLSAGLGYVIGGGGSKKGQGPFEPGGIFGGDLPICPKDRTKATSVPPTVKLDFKTAKVEESSTGGPGKVVGPVDEIKNTCTHSNEDDGKEDRTPWWRVDMAVEYVIVRVDYYGETSCCWQRDNDLEVRVGNHVEPAGYQPPFNRNGLCGEYRANNNPKGKAIVFTCPTMLYGRYLSIQKVRVCVKCPCTNCKTHYVLSICHLDIMGYKLPPKAK